LDRRLAFWIDRGGTFTDVIGRADDGVELSLKLLSASPAYDDAAVEAMRRILGVAPGAPFPADRVEAIKMGTTVATNALLERRGAKTLFVTTEGFADSLLIGDQARPDLFALNIVRPAPLYSGVVEASERLAADGAVVRPLDEAALQALLDRTRPQGSPLGQAMRDAHQSGQLDASTYAAVGRAALASAAAPPSSRVFAARVERTEVVSP